MTDADKNFHKHNQDFFQVITTYQDDLLKEPENTTHYLNIIRTCIQYQRFYDALEHINLVLQLDKNCIDAYFYRGKIAFEERNYTAALNDIKIAYKHDPKNINYTLLFAELLQKQERYNESLTVLESFQNITNRHYELLVLQAKNNAYLGKIDQAITQFNQAINMNPKNDQAAYSFALFLQDLKEYNLAIELLNHAISKNPNHAKYYIRRGYLYLEINEQEKAVDDYLKAVELDPKNEDIQVISKLI